MHRRTPILLALAVLAVLALALPAGADPISLKVDPQATEVSFHLGATGHDVEGHLFLTAGNLTLDPAAGTAAGELKIDVTRAESGNEKRDKTMRNKVFEVAQFPSIVFKAEGSEGSLQASGASEIKVLGTVSIVGGEHPLTLPATLELDGDRWTAKATFTVPYVEWGLHDPSVLFLRVAKEVEVTVMAAGAIEPPAMASLP